ncbi:MAG: TAT-variant-translocated molybdopterin oxidoreductase [Planctomycetes bacterium]|nr:TAT-variant-translocated molybdopterin oxidoreductase [Planctomycetota bacterium]
MTKTTTGKPHWRSLSELKNSPEFEEFLHREFPEAASEFPKGVSRRRWLQLMGASLALGGLSGCRYQAEKIAPLAVRPENQIPGKPQRYATSVELAGAVRHLLVTCRDGRPTKVEGNPEHPYSRGASDVFSQASILDLYDPDRSAELRQRTGGQAFTKTWEDFQRFASTHLEELKRTGGEGLCVLIEPTESVTLHDMLAALQATYPKAGVFQYASVSRENERAGSILAFGDAYRTHYVLNQAKAIVCLDADLLADHPASLKLVRDYTDGRDPESGSMNRLYAVESQFSITGAAADHRLPMRSSDIAGFLADLEACVQEMLASADVQPPPKSAQKRERFLHAVASDLVANRGKGIAAAGPRQPAQVLAQVHRLNALLENVGKTVLYTTEQQNEKGVAFDDLSSLVQRMRGGAVDTLLVLGGNPVYDAPADLQFAEALAKVEHAVHLSLYEDETSGKCEWHLPATHPFESWNAARAYDGSVCVSQPLVQPLLGGKSAIELMAMLLGESDETQAIVRHSIDGLLDAPLDDKAWRRLLHDGFLADSALPFVELNEDTPVAASEDGGGDLEIAFCVSPNVYDGRLANNGWLQETPGFLTKLTWDNAAILAPQTADELGVEHGTLVKLELGGRSVEIPAFVLPGQALGSIGVALGYGRTAAGHVGGSEADNVEPVGVDVGALRTIDAMHYATGVTVTPTGKKYTLATTQDHHAIDKVGMEETGRRVGELVRERTLEEYKKPLESHHDGGHHLPLESLWQEPSYEGHAWGMSIDLNKCIGCNACMAACQAENNVPIVGKEQVALGREMHWIRVDRYFRGDVDDPEAVHQPLTCHHCENAPCEQVCPVAATVHSQEGLNDMVYNRCVGTRYCANNCPYKVRRFNFFNNTKELLEPNRELVQLAVNPEVTVRSRGVMEKCTYCVQRIQNAKIDARSDGRPIRDGEIQTACQQACPAQAIQFGDLNQKASRVAREHSSERAYGLLAELNVKPRTKYLERIRNPHPALVDDDHQGPMESDTDHGQHS